MVRVVRNRAAGRHAAWLVGAVIATGWWLMPAAAYAQAAVPASEQRNFDIPAQALAQAMNAFGRQAGVQVSFEAGLSTGVQTRAIAGSFTPADALNRLLAGTGIVWHFTDDRAVVLSRAPAGAGVTTLDPVQVDGVRVNPHALIDNLPPAYAGGQVATGGRMGLLGNRDIMNTPFSTSNYTSKLIEDQQARSIADVLDNDASVRNIFPRTGFADQFLIRGFPVLNSDVALDGQPGIVPHNVMGLAAIERVEVIKGPNAMLNGMLPSGAVGGAINLVPKRAGDRPITQLTLDYLSDAQFGGHVDIGRRFGPDNRFGVRVNGAYRRGDTAVDRQKDRYGLGAVGLDYLGDRLRLSADLGYQQDDLTAPTDAVYVVPGISVPRAPDARKNFMQPWTFSNSRDLYGTLRGEFDLTETTTITAAGGARRHRYESLVAYNQLVASNGNTTGMSYYYPYYQDNDTAELGLRQTFNLGPTRHEVNLAANRIWRESGSTTTIFGTVASNLYNINLVPQPNWAGLSDDPPRTAAQRLSSLALADTVYAWQDRVQLTIGGRMQRVEARNYSPASGARISIYDEGRFSPAAGLLVKPWSKVSLYANYIEGLGQGPTAPAGTVNAGQVFAPFVSRQIEAGTKVDLGRVTATLGVFQITRPNGQTDPVSRVYGVDGEQRNRGVELNAFGAPIDGVRLLAGVMAIQGRQTSTAGGINDGRTAVGVPDFQLNLGAEWDPSFAPGLTVSGRLLYTSSQYLDAANTQRIPGWTRVDIGARYSFTPWNTPVTVRATVQNLFDDNYWASTANSRLVLGAPRTVLVSTSFNF